MHKLLTVNKEPKTSGVLRIWPYYTDQLSLSVLNLLQRTTAPSKYFHISTISTTSFFKNSTGLLFRPRFLLLLLQPWWFNDLHCGLWIWRSRLELFRRVLVWVLWFNVPVSVALVLKIREIP